MKRKEACEILGIAENATPEDAKKAFRNLSKKYHPDINKAPDAEAQFKKINEAHTKIASGEPDEQPFNPFRQSSSHGFGGFGIDPSMFSSFFNRSQNTRAKVRHPEIQLKTTVSFKDVVLGTQIPLTFQRHVKCEDCDGKGERSNCSACGGSGMHTQQHGNVFMQQPCAQCQGGSKNRQPCAPCKSQGTLPSETSISVNLPLGVENQQTLRLQGIGHFLGASGFGDSYGDAHLTVTVIPQEGLTLEGPHVIFRLPLSLQEALEGCQKTVPTIQGPQEIRIPPQVRHKDIQELPHLGAGGEYPQQIHYEVSYPADPSGLIAYLKESADINST